jgi:hypothetical protein
MLTQKETSRNFLCPTCEKPGPWATDSQIQAWSSQVLLHTQVVEILDRVSTDEGVDALQHAVKQAESASYLDSNGIQQAKRLAYEGFISKYIADRILSTEKHGERPMESRNRIRYASG